MKLARRRCLVGATSETEPSTRTIGPTSTAAQYATTVTLEIGSAPAAIARNSQVTPSAQPRPTTIWKKISADFSFGVIPYRYLDLPFTGHIFLESFRRDDVRPG